MNEDKNVKMRFQINRNGNHIIQLQHLHGTQQTTLLLVIMIQHRKYIQWNLI